MKNPSGAPNMVWGMYVLISLNRIYRIQLAPTKISALPGWISIQTATRLVIDTLHRKFGPLDYHDPRVQTVIQMAKSMELVKNPGRVRKNIYTFNNPGNAQKILAENFMRGANSGVASSMYIHGNRIYSYGPHFPIAQRNDDRTILIRHPSKKAPSKTTAGHISAVVNAARQVYSPDSILYDTAGELSPEAKGPAAYSNPGVRRNIYTFNNPRELNTIESTAAAVGLVVGTWAPGDGQTRYRFFLKSGTSRYGDYHQGDGIYTALGRKDALAFIAAYGKGRGARSNPKTPVYVIEGFTYHGRRGHSQRRAEFRTPSLVEARARAEKIFQETGVVVAITQRNPLTRAEVAKAARVGRRYIYLSRRSKKHGNTHAAAEAAGTAIGMGTAIGLFGKGETKRVGHRIIHRAADVELGLIPNPCSNPVCNNPRHGHVRKNPLLQTIGLMANPGSVKTFNEMQDVGKAKYVVNYHDGVKVHRDGSPFFDIAIFSSLAKKDRFVRKLKSLGFTRGTLRNPPVSEQWSRMTGRQRLAALEVIGYDTDFAGSMARRLWMTLPGGARAKLEEMWLDTSSRGTTRRRVAVPVGANPLTRTESGQILRDARFDARYGSTFQGGHTRSSRAGMAWAKAKVVRQYGPKSARRAASRIADKARTVARTAMSNPGVRFPKPGTKLTVAQAFELARRIGDRALIEQCRKALKLQKAANKDVKCVIWKTFPMGSKGQIDSVIALTHYGDSPETMYRPPPGSKKGNHMYRHNWGEKGGKQTVPLLASADGKMLLMPLEGKKVASDWLRH